MEGASVRVVWRKNLAGVEGTLWILHSTQRMRIPYEIELSFRHHVDLLCKKSYKSSSLLGYFDCFLSDHTVGCCNISFSCLSQIRRGKVCFAMSLYFCCTFFFCVTAVVSMPHLANFSPCDPNFFVLAQLFILIAC